MRQTIYASIFLGALVASSASAQNWSANVATGVPNFQSNGVVKTTTVDATPHGRGVRPRMTSEGFGTSFVYIPVTAPNNSSFGCIGLRAMDNMPGGIAQAEFWRQPRDGNPGPAVLLAGVSTIDVFAPADGFQFRTAAFAAVPINYNLYTYYIRVAMYHQGSAVGASPSVIALDVSLSGTCSH
jgi:hypothetical protein